MKKLTWDESYSMDSKVIDVHHRQLIDYINRLEDAAEKGICDKKFLTDIADRLLDYTDYHFSSEENYMKQYNYPEFDAHREEHQAFIQEVKDIKKSIEENAAGIDLKILSYLKTWLIQHILIIDKEYAIYFQNKGIHLP